MNLVVDIAEYGGRESADQAVAAVRNDIEHRLHVGGRGGDDLQDVGRGGLALQRLAGLVEQTRVLDRDHRLVGEGLKQLNVVMGKSAGLHLGRADHPYRHSGTHEWDEHEATEAAPAPRLPQALRHDGIGLDVSYLDSVTIAD